MKLVSTAIAFAFISCCSAQPGWNNPAWRTPAFDQLLRNFMNSNQLLADADPALQTIFDFASSFLLGSDEISLDRRDIEPVDILAPGASMKVDGVPMTPVPLVYKSKNKSGVRITMDMTTGKLVSATVTHPNGKSDSVVQVGNTNTFATFSSDDLDDTALEAFALQEAVPPPEERRNLRETVSVEPNSGRLSARPVIRELQSTCSTFDIVEISVVADSLFCAAAGGAGAAESLIQSIVADASTYYEVTGLCTRLQLLNTDIFCNSASDPIQPLLNAAGNSNICDSGSSLLSGFSSYVNAQQIPGDVVHLFHGKDFTGTSTLGCAWLGTLCRSGGFNSGVSEMTFSTNPTRLALLLAHENGHLLSANHVSDRNDIMFGSLSGGTSFGSTSINSIRSEIDSATCTTNTPNQPTAPAPVAAPVPAPVPAPTGTPIPAPVPNPVPSPVAVPTNPSSPSTILQSDFSSSANGFTYEDDTFRNSNSPTYAQGTYSPPSQALEVYLGGLDFSRVNNMSGGWLRTFSLPSSSSVTISIAFELQQTAVYENDEFSEFLCSVDGVLVGVGSNDYVARIAGGRGAVSQTVTLQTGALGAGNHELIVGGFNNKKTWFDEQTFIRVFSVQVTTGSGPTPPAPTPPAPTPPAPTPPAPTPPAPTPPAPTPPAPTPPAPTGSCQDSTTYTFFANGQLVGCSWVSERRFHAEIACVYNFITTNCPASCNLCP